MERRASSPDASEETLRRCRPCGFVSCRYHLLLRVQPDNGTIMFNHDDYRASETTIHSSTGPVNVHLGESRSLNARKVAGGVAAVRAMIDWAADVRLWELAHTCALDVAEAGEHTCAQVADLLSTDRERVRQISDEALAKLRKAAAEGKV